jgi:hypothetical protein
MPKWWTPRQPKNDVEHISNELGITTVKMQKPAARIPIVQASIN